MNTTPSPPVPPFMLPPSPLVMRGMTPPRFPAPAPAPMTGAPFPPAPVAAGPGPGPGPGPAGLPPPGPPSLREIFRKANAAYGDAQLATERHRDDSRKLIDINAFLINLMNLDARMTTASVASGAEGLVGVDEGLHADMVQMHQEVAVLWQRHREDNSPAGAMICLSAGIAWAVGCYVLGSQLEQGLNVSVARQLQLLRDGGYDRAYPPNLEAVTLTVADGQINYRHEVANLRRLTDFVQNG